MEQYESPEIEIVVFDTSDVITTSDAPESGFDPFNPFKSDWSN